MEPVTHVLTGACLARSGLNRRAAYATLAMAVGAEFPDIDTLWGLRGPVSSFQHHRGITHTFLGVPVEAALLVALTYAWHRWRQRSAARAVSDTAVTKRPLTVAPVRWGLLYLFTLVALLSHLLLDWTNNYGVRPFFPFNPRWYAASITFIFDPLMFLLLLGALLLPLIFRLVSSEVSGRRQTFAARGWAIAAMCGVVFLWTFRSVQHNHAVTMAMGQTLSYSPASTSRIAGDAAVDANSPTAPEQPTVLLQAQRALASPDPLSPFRWWTVTDYGAAYQLGQADTRAGTIVAAQQTQPKIEQSAALRAAEATPLGRAYLDWSPMPFLLVSHRQRGDVDDEFGPAAATVITFQDPRFMGDIPGMHGRAPLEGRVVLDGANTVLQQSMGGKVQDSLTAR